MKYKTGDPVWARTDGLAAKGISSGEYAAVVLCACHSEDGLCDHAYNPFGYVIDVLNVPCPFPDTDWCCSEAYMRPRRDDYQQREGLGSMTNIVNPIYLTEHSLEELCEEIHETAESIRAKIRRF